MDKYYCQVQWLGQVSYAAALKLQKELVAKRAVGAVPDTLLLLEHTPTYTAGLGHHREQLLISPEEMRQRKIAYHTIDRGGSIMYHGPGQLAVYPILSMKEYGYGYHAYIEKLKKVIIYTLAHFNVQAFQKRDYSGVWVLARPVNSAMSKWGRSEGEVSKIASIGIKLDQHYITSHGFFINVNPDLEFFDLIMPLSLQERSITSLRQVLNRPVEVKNVLEPVLSSFDQVFGTQLVAGSSRITDLNESLSEITTIDQ